MARDTKPPEIEVKRDDFSTEDQELAAQRLLEHWSTNLSFKELAEEMYPDGPSASLYQNVYKEYFGIPGDKRTIEQIRQRHDSITNYLDERAAGNIDPKYSEGPRELTDREHALMQEGYKMALEEMDAKLDERLDDEFDKGWDRALDMAKKMGVDEVPRMREDKDKEESEDKEDGFSF